MIRKARLAGFAIVLAMAAMVAVAGHKDAPLDGTSWKVEVEPDTMAKEKGHNDYEETLTFADGMLSATEGKKVGFKSSHYKISKAGEKWTFNANLGSDSDGEAVWSGTVDGNNMEGNLVHTKPDGTVLTYNFHGNKLD